MEELYEIMSGMTHDGIGITLLVVVSVLAAVLLYLLLYGLATWVGTLMAEEQVCRARVLKKHYRPSSSGTVVGTSYSPQGGVGTAVSTVYHSERFLVEFEVLDGCLQGARDRESVSESLYDSIDEGNELRMTFKLPKIVGGISWKGIERIDV